MPKMIAVLGGGSVWTPHLMEQLAELALDTDLQIRIQGPTESHLHEVATFARRLVGGRLDIAVTTNLEEVVHRASIILNQARIGGWSARIHDEVSPVQLGMVGDESLGLGGLQAAVRAKPFIAEVSKAIIKYAPDAWVLNLMNPSDLVSRAWREAGCRRVASLCDQPQTLMRELAAHTDRPESAFRFDFIGMTHVGWLIPPPDIPIDQILRRRPELTPWAQEWKAIPTPWRMYLSNPDALFFNQRRSPGHRARQLGRLAEQLRSTIREQDAEQYRMVLKRRFPSWYSEVVVPAIRGLLGVETARLIVGLPNDDSLPDLDKGVQVERWAVLKNDEIHAEAYTENALCREDIIRFGRTRALAFAAMTHSDSDSVERYARSDAFITSASQVDLRALQGAEKTAL